MQPPQGVVAQVRLPEDEDATGSGAQHLLGCPQGVGRALGGDPEQLLRRDAPVGQRQRLWGVRWRQQCDRASAAGGQGGAEQAQFTDPGLALEQFCQAANRPAAAGQFAVQRGMSGRHGARL